MLPYCGRRAQFGLLSTMRVDPRESFYTLSGCSLFVLHASCVIIFVIAEKNLRSNVFPLWALKVQENGFELSKATS